MASIDWTNSATAKADTAARYTDATPSAKVTPTDHKEAFDSVTDVIFAEQMERKFDALVAADNRKARGDAYPNDIELIFGGTATGESISSTTVTNVDFYSEKGVTTSGAGSENKQFTYSSNLVFTNRSAVLAWVWIEDVSAIVNVTLDIYSLYETQKWSRSYGTGVAMQGGSLVNGWNLLRWPVTTGGDAANFGTVDRIRWVWNTDSAIDIKFGPIGVEMQPKARVIFVVDGARRNGWDSGSLATGQTTSGIDELAARTPPYLATWGINAESIENADADRLTAAELATLKAAGHAMSFHRYSDSIATSGMTEAQMRADVFSAQKWAEDNSLGITRWRSGVLQNNGPYARNMVNDVGLLATATGEELTGANDLIPWRDRGSVRRKILHGQSTATMDTWFTELQTNRETMVIYTHKIVATGTDNGVDVDLDEWEYFLGKLDTAVAAGWLQVDTYETITAELDAIGAVDTDAYFLKALKSRMNKLSRAT